MKLLLAILFLFTFFAKSQFCVRNYGNISGSCHKDTALLKKLNKYVKAIYPKKHLMIDTGPGKEYTTKDYIIGIGKVHRENGPLRLLRAKWGIVIYGPPDLDRLIFLINKALN